MSAKQWQPCLYLFVSAVLLRKRRKEQEEACACRLKLSIPKPQCFPQQIRNTCTCALYSFLCSASLFSNFNLRGSNSFLSVEPPPLPQTQGAPDFCEVTVGKYAYGQGEPQLCEVDCRLISLATLAATVISRIICKIGWGKTVSLWLPGRVPR